MAQKVEVKSLPFENLQAKKERCLREIEIEFKDLVSILESRKIVLQNQVEVIIKEISDGGNGHIRFTTDSAIKEKLKTFGDIQRKTPLQAKSPPPLNTLSPIPATNLYTHQSSPYFYSQVGFQFGVSLDENVRDAHPSMVTETKIRSDSNGFKPLCVKRCENMLYVVSQDEFIYVIDEMEGEVTQKIAINFGLFFPAITIVDTKIVFGHSSQFGGKIWVFSQKGVILNEIVEVPNYGRIKLLSDLDITTDNRVLIVDSDTNLVLVVLPDFSKVEERIGRQRKLVSPTRVAVNTNNELYILHKRGTTIDVYNIQDECLKSFHLRHQTFASEHIRYNPDLLVTDDCITLIFDNLVFVYNLQTGVFSQAKLDGVCGVIPKCIVTSKGVMIAVKHDYILKYDLYYFD
ncbi:hypothetical protein LOD99_9672 [Oopsacas minuta]|uniref:Uncharacterized protein n=1 Tax=Oopsacas minuta TaxID=111878 RepID=A0AAV7KTR6_9METZ|nr:hypothetical protein LOD99_9672 [Oopsacas minuta]